MAFGSDRSRFNLDRESKRAVEDKDLGPLVATSMNRCIHCTRCVRFATEVAGVQELGTTGRGNDMQIGTYVEKAVMASELSGNLIDLCPVGALTSKPYAFKARPWELRHADSLDVMDAMGASIRVDSRGPAVMRILPRLNEAVNEEWLGDKSRFACDALTRQRLLQPMARHDQAFVPLSWQEALQQAASLLRSARNIEAVAGPHVDCETLVAAKDLLSRLAHAPQTRLTFDGPAATLPCDHPGNYRLNPTIAGLEQADAVLLVGCNPKREAPLLMARLRKQWLCNPQMHVALLGEPCELTVDYHHLGADLSTQSLQQASEFLRGAQRPLLLLGQEHTGPELHAFVVGLQSTLPRLIQPDWNGLAWLPLWASRTGALELGWGSVYQPAGGSQAGGLQAGKSQASGPWPDLLLLLGADNLPADRLPPPGTPIIYLGTHGDAGALQANLLLPGAAYTEKDDASWVNLEGRWQASVAAVPPPGEARSDWLIIRAMAEVAGVNLDYSDQASVWRRLAECSPLFDPANLGRLPEAPDLLSLAQAELQCSAEQAASSQPKSELASPIVDYYLTDAISRNSLTMAECSRAFNK